MMKRYLIAFFLMFFVGSASAATTFLSTEKNLWFTPDVVVNAVVEHFNDESKHMPMLDLYQELMDEQTGKVSVDILFKVCNKGGLNTRRAEGYAQCKAFIEQMLKDAEMAAELNLGGYCPGLDANGKNPNSLRSITDETRVGDFCSSTNIASGEVVFKAGYACTCLAYQCNTGYRFRTRGDCVTPQQEPTDRNVNASNYCPRTQTTGASNNNSTEKCKSYCTQTYKDKDCYWDALIWDKDKNVCICNPTDQEISDKRARDEEKRKNQKFFDVCNRSSKGKSGGQEVCVNNVFNWVNVTRMQAVELAKMWAKKHKQDEIHCDDGNIKTVAKVWGEQSVDDYLMCASLDSNIFYTFQFDDVKESIDSDIQAGLVHGICVLYGYSSNIVKNDTLTNAIGRRGCYTTCTNELKSAGANFELTVKQDGNLCTFEQRSFSKEDADKYLAKFGNLDNYHFMSDQIQTQGSQSGTNNNIYGYIASQGYVIRNLECVPNPAELKGKWYQDDDDILRCYLSVGGDPKRHPIDFVFNDISESWSYKYEAGEAAMGCLGSGGKYEGKECYGLSQAHCTKMDQDLKRQNPGSSGTRWDAKNQMCVLVDQAEAYVFDKAVQVGTAAIAAVDCATVIVGNVQGVMGCALFAVEMASLTAEITSEVLIQDRVQEFLRASTICKARACAKGTIQQLGAKVISVKDSLDDHSIKNVDEELARLILLLEPEDLQSELSDGDWNSMVAAVGGETDDWTGTALVWINRIGFIGQFASLGASSLRLLTKAPQALKTLLRSADNIAAAADDVADMTKALVVYDATKAADAAADAAKGAKAADAAADAAKAADKASDAGKAAGGATSGAKAADAAADAGRAANNASKSSRPANLYASWKSSGKGEFEFDFSVLGQNEDELLEFVKMVDKDGFFVQRIGNKVFVKSIADAASDAGRAANNATDAGRAANNAADAGRATGATADKLHDGLSLNKKQFALKYHPDKVAHYRNPKIDALANEILQKGLEGVDKLTDAEKLALSKKMFELDELIATASKTADKAADAGKAADKAADAGKAAGEATSGAKAADAADAAADAGKSADDATDAARAQETIKKAQSLASSLGGKVTKIDDADVVFSKEMSIDDAERMVEQINAGSDFFAVSLNTKGSAGAAHKIIAVPRSQIGKLGTHGWNGHELVKSMSKSNLQNLARAKNMVGETIAQINNTPVKLHKFGVKSTRPVAILDIGGKKFPFYVSSGSAGKTDVATGKWEIFGGILKRWDPETKSWYDWFGKTNIKDINNHYNSPEFKYLARVLDEKLGDVRDTEDILASIGRESLGGNGKVAHLEDADLLLATDINETISGAWGYSKGEDVRNVIESMKRALERMP